MLTIAFVQAGADFAYRENYNDLLQVEWMGGDSEMTEKEYAEGRYCRDQLRPETGGRYFWCGCQRSGVDAAVSSVLVQGSQGGGEAVAQGLSDN
jgi:hypothetical protein